MNKSPGELPSLAKVKVAFVGAPDLEFYGGTQKTVILLATLLSKSNYDVTIFGSGTYFERRQIEIDNSIKYERNAFRLDPLAWRAVQMLSRGVSEPLIGMFTSRYVFKKIKGYDIYYFTAPKFLLYSFLKHNKGNARVIVGNHGTYYEYLSSRNDFISRSLLNLLDSILLKYLNRRGTYVHAQTLSQEEHYKNRGISGDKVFVIPLCDVDFSSYALKKNKILKVVFLNRLSEDKGADLIPVIAKICKDIEFEVIGAGPLMNLIKKVSPENVKIEGFLPEKEKREKMEECDIMLNLSKYESLSTSSIEGIACGQRILSLRRTTGLEFIHEKVPEAVIFSDGSVEGICREIMRIKEFMEKDRDKFEEVKSVIRAKGEQIFDRKIISEKMKELFQKVMIGD
ncbi:MAG: glycosyltransferase family 4 protein [Candidatus Parvarchaeota archaeon]